MNFVNCVVNMQLHKSSWTYSTCSWTFDSSQKLACKYFVTFHIKTLCLCDHFNVLSEIDLNRTFQVCYFHGKSVYIIWGALLQFYVYTYLSTFNVRRFAQCFDFAYLPTRAKGLLLENTKSTKYQILPNLLECLHHLNSYVYTYLSTITLLLMYAGVAQCVDFAYLPTQATGLQRELQIEPCWAPPHKGNICPVQVKGELYKAWELGKISYQYTVQLWFSDAHIVCLKFSLFALGSHPRCTRTCTSTTTVWCTHGMFKITLSKMGLHHPLSLLQLVVIETNGTSTTTPSFATIPATVTVNGHTGATATTATRATTPSFAKVQNLLMLLAVRCIQNY